MPDPAGHDALHAGDALRLERLATLLGAPAEVVLRRCIRLGLDALEQDPTRFEASAEEAHRPGAYDVPDDPDFA